MKHFLGKQQKSRMKWKFGRMEEWKIGESVQWGRWQKGPEEPRR
jgi:hypothetical protein